MTLTDRQKAEARKLLASQGATAGHNARTPEERTEKARKAARARWDKAKQKLNA